MRGILKYDVMMGCDPEFFFFKEGKVCGAEKVIPKDGLVYDCHISRTNVQETAKIIIDGVQAELNPKPYSCRAYLGDEIQLCFKKIYDKIKIDTSLSVEFLQVTEVREEELKSLSEQAKKFGCAPSSNLYSKSESKIEVNPEIYRFRSAGGHIHLGRDENTNIKMINTLKQYERVVTMLDILLGNTCVLIDKNEWAKERRKVYGKAGEYRLPAHGIEYRTLSNFWLQSYQLMSFVMGMARFSINVVLNNMFENIDYETPILKETNIEDIINAINNNDFDLAYKNFKKIEDLIAEAGVDYFNSYPLSTRSMKEFKHFITKDLSYWFPENPLKHWIEMPEGHEHGWESFSRTSIRNDMNKK